MANDLAKLYKYGFIENARMLARESGRMYEVFLSFESAEQRDRALANIAHGGLECSVRMLQVDGQRWKPLGQVFPDGVVEAIETRASNDHDLIETNLLSTAKRMETSGPSDDFVTPDLSPEEHALAQELRERRKKPV